MAPRRVAANLSNDEARAAIPKLERRLREPELLRADQLTLQDGDNQLTSFATTIDATLTEVYGRDSIEFERNADGPDGHPT